MSGRRRGSLFLAAAKRCEVLTRDGRPRLVGRAGICRLSEYPAAQAGARAFLAARAEARARSRQAGRKGALTPSELAAVHEAANLAEAAVGNPQVAREVATTVWSRNAPQNVAGSGQVGRGGSGAGVDA